MQRAQELIDEEAQLADGPAAVGGAFEAARTSFDGGKADSAPPARPRVSPSASPSAMAATADEGARR